jgi:hypothetical protein
MTKMQELINRYSVAINKIHSYRLWIDVDLINEVSPAGIEELRDSLDEIEAVLRDADESGYGDMIDPAVRNTLNSYREIPGLARNEMVNAH